MKKKRAVNVVAMIIKSAAIEGIHGAGSSWWETALAAVVPYNQRLDSSQ